MFIPLKYNLRYLVTRWTGTLTTGLTFALVVGVFVMVMAMVEGITKSLTTAGNPLNVLMMRKGVLAEGQSVVTLDQFHAIQDLPGIATDGKGQPMVAPEMVTLINRPKIGSGDSSNVQMRGVSAMGMELRPMVKVIEGKGRMFNPGLRELIVSESISKRFQGLGLGQKVQIGRGDWTVVGLFDAGQSAFSSEIWMDYHEMMQEFDRHEYNTAVIRAVDAAAVVSLQKLAEDDKRIQLMAKTEKKYYEEQTSSAKPLQIFGFFLALTMSIGASFAAMNTMYASVAGRVREIGTLRILGYTPSSILFSFLMESIMLALFGGAAGCVIATGLMKVLNYAPAGTANFQTFSEVVFYFNVTPQLAMMGMGFALAMGIVGGILPAWGAAGKPILNALRQI